MLSGSVIENSVPLNRETDLSVAKSVGIVPESICVFVRHDYGKDNPSLINFMDYARRMPTPFRC